MWRFEPGRKVVDASGDQMAPPYWSSHLQVIRGKSGAETRIIVSSNHYTGQADQVAFLDHPIYLDDKGAVSVVDLEGHKRVVSAAWESVQGLAWSADGTEIWFSAAQAGTERHIYAVDLSGHQRLIFRAPAGVTLEDIAPDGSVRELEGRVIHDQPEGLLVLGRQKGPAHVPGLRVHAAADRQPQ